MIAESLQTTQQNQMAQRLSIYKNEVEEAKEELIRPMMTLKVPHEASSLRTVETNDGLTSYGSPMNENEELMSSMVNGSEQSEADNDQVEIYESVEQLRRSSFEAEPH